MRLRNKLAPFLTTLAIAASSPSAEAQESQESPATTKTTRVTLSYKAQVHAIIEDSTNDKPQCRPTDKETKEIESLKDWLKKGVPIIYDYDKLLTFVKVVGECSALAETDEETNPIIRTELSEQLLSTADYTQQLEVAIYLLTYHKKEISIQTMGDNFNGGTYITRAFESIYAHLYENPNFPINSKRLLYEYSKLIDEATKATASKDYQQVKAVQSKIESKLQEILADLIQHFNDYQTKPKYTVKSVPTEQDELNTVKVGQSFNQRKLHLTNLKLPAYLGLESQFPNLEKATGKCKDPETKVAINYYFTDFKNQSNQDKQAAIKLFEENVADCFDKKDLTHVDKLLEPINPHDLKNILLSEYLYTPEFIIGLYRSKQIKKLTAFHYLLRAITFHYKDSEDLITNFGHSLVTYLENPYYQNKETFDKYFILLKNYIKNI